MKVNDYTNLCFRTWNPSLDTSNSIMNAFLGLYGEIAELSYSLDDFVSEDKEPEIGEFGDVFYYMNVLFHKINDKVKYSSFEEFFNEIIELNEKQTNHRKMLSTIQQTDEHMFRALGMISELIKKHIYHGKDFRFSDFYTYYRLVVMWYLNRVSEMHYSLEDIMIYNIDKLKKRYPEGFDKLNAST